MFKKSDTIKFNLCRPIRIQDLVDEYEKLIANDYYHLSHEFKVRFFYFLKRQYLFSLETSK